MKERYTYEEEQLRRLSDEFSLQIDSDALWNEIEGKLPPVEVERKRMFFWWVTGNLAVILLVVGTLFLFPGSKGDDGVMTSQNKEQPIAENGNMITKKQEQNRPEQAVKSSIELPLPVQSSTRKENSKSAAKNPAEIIQSTDLKTTTQTPETVQRTDLKSSQFPDLAHNTDSKSTKDILKSTHDVATTIDADRYDEKSFDRNKEVIDQDSDATHLAEDLVNSSNGTLIEKEESTVASRNMLSSFKTLEPVALKQLVLDELVTMPSPTIRPVKSKRWLPAFAFLGGVNIHENHVATRGNETLDFSRIESEQVLPGWSTSMRYIGEHTSGWRLGLGLSYNRFVSRFERNETVSSTIEITGNQSSQIDGNGNISYIEGSLTETTITEYDYLIHRKHDVVDLQMILGRKILGYGGFSISTDLMISHSLFTRHDGYFFVDSDEAIQRFKAGEASPYKGNLIHAGLSLDMEYNFGKFAIAMRPFMERALNNMTEATNYYQLKNSRYGVQLGIVYRP